MNRVGASSPLPSLLHKFVEKREIKQLHLSLPAIHANPLAVLQPAQGFFHRHHRRDAHSRAVTAPWESGRRFLSQPRPRCRKVASKWDWWSAPPNRTFGELGEIVRSKNHKSRAFGLTGNCQPSRRQSPEGGSAGLLSPKIHSGFRALSRR